MKITIIYDNCSSKSGLKTGWGFSSLIEVSGTRPILFDTGIDGTALLHNMKELDVDPGQVGTIFISHAHGDHTGGLADILRKNKNAEIYVPASAVVRLPGRKVTMVSQPIQISEAVFSTGELEGIEQSLAIRTSKGILVVTGCSHAGVGIILNTASLYGKVYGIVGGLHGFRNFSRLDNLSVICPCHCTQHKSEIRHLFAEQYIECGAGLVLEI